MLCEVLFFLELLVPGNKNPLWASLFVLINGDRVVWMVWLSTPLINCFPWDTITT